jgi:hypothetical protein
MLGRLVILVSANSESSDVTARRHNWTDAISSCFPFNTHIHQCIFSMSISERASQSVSELNSLVRALAFWMYRSTKFTLEQSRRMGPFIPAHNNVKLREPWLVQGGVQISLNQNKIYKLWTQHANNNCGKNTGCFHMLQVAKLWIVNPSGEHETVKTVSGLQNYTLYCILASCYIRLTLNICSFVRQCNTFTS